MTHENEEEITRLRADFAKLDKWITGNGDPTKGLLWAVAKLGDTDALITKLITEVREEVATNQRNAVAWREVHDRRPSQQPLGEEIRRDAVKILVNASIVIVLSILGLGIATFIRNGGHF